MKLLLCLFCGIIALAFGPSAQAASITDYATRFRAVTDQGGVLQCMIRSFRADGMATALLVNPATLETSTVPLGTLRDAPYDSLLRTPYFRALEWTSAPPVALQNHGLIRAVHPVQGHFLTVDLCPSRRPFEQAFFEMLAVSGQPRPVPVAIAISGGWLVSHEWEFAWLREQERLGHLAITWVNHSLTHPYDGGLPYARTFLLTPGLDLSREVLGLERLLLERGVVPAVFFRFPGLVADETVMGLVREMGLLPLGSDAWLAKGEHPREGSIILVHGNGNEPSGIRRFGELIRRAATRLLPLPRVVIAGTGPKD